MPAPPAGLCDTCRHQRIVSTTRGSRFSLCERSRSDPAYPKYPRLPVVRCPGYEPAAGAGARSDVGRPGTQAADDRSVVPAPAAADKAPMVRTPAVECRDCGFAWNSATMAEGLRSLGSCPRCGGELHFHAGAEGPAPAPGEPRPVAPHLVLGIPRR